MLPEANLNSKLTFKMNLLLTFKAEDPLPKRINNIFQSWLVCHIKEVLVIGVAGDVLDFIKEGLWIYSSAVVVAKYLRR